MRCTRTEHPPLGDAGCTGEGIAQGLLASAAAGADHLLAAGCIARVRDRRKAGSPRAYRNGLALVACARRIRQRRSRKLRTPPLRSAIYRARRRRATVPSRHQPPHSLRRFGCTGSRMAVSSVCRRGACVVSARGCQLPREAAGRVGARQPAAARADSTEPARLGLSGRRHVKGAADPGRNGTARLLLLC